MSRIVQVANFVTPSSGGLRTALGHLAEGYGAAGHHVVQIIPGPADTQSVTAWGSVVTLRAPRLPGTGYRVHARLGTVSSAVKRARPDRLEVHDRTTLRRLGRSAAARDVPSLVVSHERLDRLLAQWLPPSLPLTHWADRSNRALARGFGTVVCTTRWAAEEFVRLGTPNLSVVPLGVDLDRFHPDRADPVLRSTWAEPGTPLLIMASRLSREKHPALALDALRELGRRGRAVWLLVAGDGPMRRNLARQGQDLPVRWLGFVSQTELAAALATADILLAPGPIETFGLAALEALASGTPVVARSYSALTEVLGSAGVAAAGSAFAFADAIESLLDAAGPATVRTARERAESFPWSATVAGFLSAHGLANRVGAR